MRYAEIATERAIDRTLTYHIPPELEDTLEPGHLVRLDLRTAAEPGIVVRLHDEPPMYANGNPIKTKPVIETLVPDPVVNAEQIALAQWMSERYLSPLGPCLWLWLPPGLVGRKDVVVHLLKEDAAGDDTAQIKIIDALKRRGTLTGTQLSRVVKHAKERQSAIQKLEHVGIVRTESILASPRVKPRKIQVASLAIQPEHIPYIKGRLGKANRLSDLFATIARMEDEDDAPPYIGEITAIPGIGAATIDNLLETGWVELYDGEFLQPHDDTESALFELRKGETDLHVLNVLAREDKPIDVSWIYAQTDAKLTDLKRLESYGLVHLGEQQSVRDSLADRVFVPTSAPRLTPGQREVWREIKGVLENMGQSERVSTSPPPVSGEAGRGYIDWKPSPELWRKLKPLARQMRHEPTQAENVLWQHLRKKQLHGYKFRRQYAIDRFIVDFICTEARLIIEVDGEIHQYTQKEDAIRQAYLEAMGFFVIRFDNQDVYDHIDGVLSEITNHLQVHPTPNPSPKAERGITDSSTAPLESDGAAEVRSNCFLLHGVTGSGKTEIYLRAIEHVLAQGRQAIFLVPEIALTAQMIRRVAARFPDQVGILHSRLSDGERYDTWHRARSGELGVIVGARSALFTPMPDIGLVILDEEHDHSYKQTPPVVQPYYHTRDVAERMMRDNNGVLILGSATPDVETYFRAQRGEIRYLHLPDRIMGHRVRIAEQSEKIGIKPRYTVEPSDHSDALTIPLPPVEVVDMRAELKTGNTEMFSRKLQDALKETLARGEQAILFLNRRGASTYVFCRDCGYVANCKNCDMPMTYHAQDGRLHCHHCGNIQQNPTSCPNCYSRKIRYFGAGTQHVENTFNAHFPNAVSLRWDGDTAAQSGAHDLILQRFMNRQADVLIGTQMIAKGLDLPLVTLVGVVSSDVGLNLPDFRAGEKTFQLLTQVAGRAGRGLLGGQVILQTYQPDNYAVMAASQHDYEGFYKQEIGYRRDMGYPPFRRMARILYTDPVEQKAHDAANGDAEKLRRKLENPEYAALSLIGPTPCFFSRLNRMYRWQILLRGPDPSEVLRELTLDSRAHIDVDPVDVL